MVGLVIIVLFVAVWVWIFYQLYKAPQVDNDEIIEENDSFLDFEEDEEFLN